MGALDMADPPHPKGTLNPVEYDENSPQVSGTRRGSLASPVRCDFVRIYITRKNRHANHGWESFAFHQRTDR
jgi:hypothetical protein